jgi:hypothetical protein
MSYRTDSSFPRVILICVAVVLALYLSSRAAALPPTDGGIATLQVDPDKGPSELNHHIAGVFLVVIGAAVILARRRPSLTWLQWLPGILFITAGVFLAAWSDSEIWPRGTWSWLSLWNDKEALQHKIYAVLLVGIGLLECAQVSRRYRGIWLTVAFSTLALIGGISLVFHSHGGSEPPSGIPMQKPAQSAEENHSGHPHVAATVEPESHHHSHPSPATTSAAPDPSNHSHAHMMTASAIHIQKEHAWFAVIGVCVAMLKLLQYSAGRSSRIRPYLWAHAVIILGVMLLLYSE